MRPPLTNRPTSSRPATRTLALLAALLLSATLLQPATPANAGTTRAELTRKAKRLVFDTGLTAFTLKKRRAERNDDSNALDWSDNGCSSPVPTGFNGRFNRACERHDFAYRNLGNGVNERPSLALDSTEDAKKAADSQMLADMRYSCEDFPGPNDPCNRAALAYYLAVSRAGESWTRFYDHECTPGYFCLFDDTGFADRRKRFTVSHDDMNDFDFGDKASAVKNRTSDAWVIYDDDGYDDRNYCIPAGGTVRSLGDKWSFNDKTSSVERLSRASCP